MNQNGNPYGAPVKYLDVLGANVSPTADGISLEKEMPIGIKVYLLGKPADSPSINFVALQVKYFFVNRQSSEFELTFNQ